MAEPRNRTHSKLDQTPVIPLPHSIFTTDDSPSSTMISREDLDFIRPSKRRKNCPSVLERLRDLTPDSSRSFSFTFDASSVGFAPEFTPKFGSFNLAKWERGRQQFGSQIREEEEEEKVGEEEQEEKKEAIFDEIEKAISDRL